MKRRLAELLVLLAVIAGGVAWSSRKSVPQLDWKLARGPLALDGIPLGVTPQQAFARMWEAGGLRPEHVYHSHDGKTQFVGIKEVVEIATTDCIDLPDGTRLRVGEPLRDLARRWPLRPREDLKGRGSLATRLSEGGSWYEGAGGLWVYASREGALEYFDLSREPEQALGGPGGF